MSRESSAQPTETTRGRIQRRAHGRERGARQIPRRQSWTARIHAIVRWADGKLNLEPEIRR